MNLEDTSLLQVPFKFDHYQKNDLASFLPGENQALLNLLNKISTKESIHSLYLWGTTDVGKTHLLQAVCKRAHEGEQHVAYIPLKQHQEMSHEMLYNLGKFDLVCVDDIDAACGQIQWQQSLTWLYNELRDNSHSMLISGRPSPANIKLEVADLKSRLNGDQVYQIQVPDDDLKIAILKQTAVTRSFELNDDVIEYLIRRVDRDLGSLMKTLDKLDHASLAAKRKITVPFLKNIIKAEISGS